MIDLIKEMWFKRKVRVYRKLISKITELRRVLNAKQKKYNERVEHYTKKYNEANKLED